MLGLVFVSCVVAGLLWFLATPLRTGLWSIPGPFWRRYTDLFQAYDAYKGRTCQVIKRLQQQYGPVVLVGPRTVMFSDPSMVDTIYATRNPFPKSYHWQPFRTELNGIHFPSLLASEDTQTHSSLKRPISGVYAMSNVIKSEAYINENIVLFVKRVYEEYHEADRIMPVFQWMHFYAYDTIMKLTVSNDFGLMKGEADRKAMFKGVDSAQTYRAMVACMPWVHNLLKNTPVTQVFQKRMGSFPARARELIQNRRARGAGQASDGREDLLSQILTTRDKHPGVVDERVMHGYATTPLLAGADTVTIGLTSVVYFVGGHPRVLARLRGELDASGLAMPPTWAAVQGLAYLDAVVRESFRCHPIGAMLSRRAVPYDGPGLQLQHSGARLPPGTAVAISGYTTHFNKDVYGDDVYDFRPERWLQGPEESAADYTDRMRRMNRADLTWGHGDRACMGKNIARCEMYKLIATFYSYFDVRPADPARSWTIKETVLAKQEGVEVKIKLRDGASIDQLQKNIESPPAAASMGGLPSGRTISMVY